MYGGFALLAHSLLTQGIHVGDVRTTAAYQSLFVSQWLPVKSNHLSYRIPNSGL